MITTRPFASSATAVACALALHLSCAGLLMAQAPQKDESSGDKTVTTVLEKFEVTGSRVKRLDYETASPVVTFTSAAIEDKGYYSLGEFMQSLPYNNSTSNSDYTTGTFNTGAATVNPRGLGANRVLTLVNGRRAVPYALTNSSSGTAKTEFNFNSIPQAAIDRIEYLKDGASAIYGSDAITGVYNIILKKNYSGTSVDTAVSNTFGHDTLRRTVNFFTGISKEGWEITGGFTFQTRAASYIKDYGVTTTNYTYLGQKGTNMNSTIFHPSYLFLTAAQATQSGIGTAGGAYVVAPAGTTNPTKASFTFAGASTANVPLANRFDFANFTQFQPASESGGAYASVERKLNPNITAFANGTYNRALTHYEQQPYGFSTSLAGLTLPANNPYNPTGIPLTVTTASAPFTFRGDTMPKREVVSNTINTTVGVRGIIGGRWNWEAAGTYGKNDSVRDTDLINATTLQAALNGTTRETAYNPFGPQANPNLEKSFYTRSRGLDGKWDTSGFDFNVNGALVQLPLRGAGELGVAAGFEHRQERQTSNPEPNNFIGFTATTPFTGKRHVNAGYIELTAPVQKWLEFQFAGRHERYSDFGNTTKPKVGVKLRLPSNRVLDVVLRASYSESFKAPDLGQLYQPQSNAVTTASLLDPLRPQDAARQLPSRVGGNPNLKPEDGKVQYFGAVFEVPAIKGLSFTVDYFDTQITNWINSLSASYLLSAEGRRLYPNAITRDNSTSNPGPITSIDAISGNIGLQLYRGVDYGIIYNLRNTRLGSFNFTALATQVIKAGRDTGTGSGFFNNTGLAFDIEWRYNYSLGWSYKNWGARVGADVIGKFFNDNWTAAGWGENVYTTINPSVTYRGFRKLTLTLGFNNVLDHRPPANGFRALGFDDRLYSAAATGIVGTFRVRKQF